jgi:hypothetical protein
MVERHADVGEHRGGRRFEPFVALSCSRSAARRASSRSRRLAGSGAASAMGTDHARPAPDARITRRGSIISLRNCGS